MENKELFELSNNFRSLFEGTTYPWEVVAKLANFIAGQKSIGEGTVIEDGAVIMGPAIIGKNCQIRSGAYIRENVVIGDNVVIGHASELKNCVVMDGAQIAHFNYIGDSVVGNKAHFAAGSIAANTKLSPGEIVVKADKEYNTGLRKFGSAVGDGAEIGCNAVLNPGSIIGKGSAVYPLVAWRGVLLPNKIAKSAAEVIDKR